MMDKQIDGLDFESLKKGIEHCLTNSDHLINCADQLAETKNYDVATSLLILSCEESIKTAMLMSKHFGVESEIPIHKFFRDHNIKHEEIAKVLKLLSGLDIMINLASPSLKGFAESLLSISELITSKTDEWWKDANSLKQIGFYVDFSNGQWIAPSQITMKDYLIAHKQATQLLNWLRKGNALLSKDNFKLSKR